MGFFKDLSFDTTKTRMTDYLTSNPGASDASIAKAMETLGVSPSDMSKIVGVPEGEIAARVAATVSPGMSVTLGDTVVAPQYRTTGSGMDEQIGALETFTTSKSNGDVNYKAPVGTPVNIYSPTGELVNTVKTKKDLSFVGGFVDMLKDPVVLAAVGGAAAGGLLGPAAGTAGAAGAEALGAEALGTGIGAGAPGMGGAGGITSGYSGLGINPGTVGLGAEGLGAGITAGSGLTGTGVLTGSALGTNLLGSSALNNLVGTGVLAGSTLGTSLLGPNAGPALTGTGILTGSNLGTSLLGAGAGALGATGVNALAGAAGAGGAGGVIPPVVPAGGSTLTSLLTPAAIAASGLVGASTAKSAAETQAESAREANALLYKMYQEQKGLQEPFRGAGITAQNRLLDLLGLSQNRGAEGFGRYAKDFGMSDFTADPGYAFRLAEGQKTLERNAAARGGLISGGALKAATRYGQDMGSQEYQSAFNRYQTNRANQLNPLGSLLSSGQAAASNQAAAAGNYGTQAGGNITGAGAATAAGQVGSVNALTNALSGYLNYSSSQNLADAIRKSTYGG